MNHDEDDDFDIEEIFSSIDFMVDKVLVSDAADYFSSVLTHEFPTLELEPLEANEWREGWWIRVPAQFERPVREVEELAISLRDRLWWEKSVLLPFAIEQLFEVQAN